MIFVGKFNHTLDAKNRVFIPAKYREYLGESFYITPKLNKNCLGIYTKEAFEEIEEKINSFPDSEVASIKNLIFPITDFVTPDSNGRITLSSDLLKHAGIDKNIIIVGSGNHLQVWSEDNWNKEETTQDLTAIRSRLAGLGL